MSLSSVHLKCVCEVAIFIAVLPSVHPSVYPSVQAFSWNCVISFFLKFGMVLESHVLLCVTEPDFLGKFFLSPKLGKWAQNGSKSGFFQFIGKFGH